MSTDISRLEDEEVASIPTILPGTLQVSPLVGRLFLAMLQPKKHVQLYCNLVDHSPGVIAEFLEGAEMRVSGISTQPLSELHDLNECRWSKESKHYQHITTANPEYFAPEDRYHYAFGVFPFEVSLDPEQINRPTSPLYKEDRLSQWQCSKYSHVSHAKNKSRLAASHLIGLEGLMRATIVGGYFAAVLPKRWVGREQTYLRWWSERTAIVARIGLPADWVTAQNSEGERQSIPGGWELVIWQKAFHFDKRTPNSTSKAGMISTWAEFRHPQFIYRINSQAVDFPEEINDCASDFRLSEWWQLSVANFNECVDGYYTDPVYGTSMYKPHPLPRVEDTWFLDPNDQHQIGIRVVPTKYHITGNRAMGLAPIANAVHIRVSNRIKLAAYGEHGYLTAGLLCDLRNRMGYTSSEGEKKWKIDGELRTRNFSEFKDELLELIEMHGLVPVMTQNDYDRVKAREKWLSIQLTPIERWIPIQRGKRTSDELSSDTRAWELIYDDIGMETTYPELMNLWRARAKAIGLNKVGTTFEFQFGDVVVGAAKQCVLNGNVMGLGKTRETLAIFILRGGKHLLIICPAKLIGVWQDEIRDFVAPYMQRQKKNWDKKLFKCSLNIIQQANDLKRSNLKTFNLISYDTLKSTPKDAQFYRCPKCGVIICKKIRSDYIPTCPGNPALPKGERCNEQVKEWRQACKNQGVRKTYWLTQDGINPIRRLRYSEVKPTKRQLQNGAVPFPQEKILVRDSRPKRPEIQKMVELDNIHKKMKCRREGVRKDDKTGEMVPNYVWKEREPIHVKWTFANLVRRLFNHAAADESQYAANKDTARTLALLHTQCIQTKYALTGTPVKGYPLKLLPIANWCFSRPTYPLYRLHNPDGISLYTKRYQTTVTVVRSAKCYDDDDDTDRNTDTRVLKARRPSKNTTGEKKIVPKINNPEMFQAEIAPLMIRHVRTEPQVVRDIPRKIVESIDHKIPMDEDHHDYYQLWIDSFAEWWQAKMEEEEKKRTGEGNLLAKLSYLYQAAVNPRHMLDNIEKSKDEEIKKWANMIGRYDTFLERRGKKPKFTQKFIRLRELITEAIRNGNKSIVACTRHANLALGQRWCDLNDIGCVRVDGSVSLKIKDGESRSPRHALVDEFRRNRDLWVAWCGLEAMAEGMNVPEANEGFVNDYTWDPTAIRQFIGRMIRPAQTKIIKAHYLFHIGTIEEYMAALCYLKGRSGDEGIDYMSFSDFKGAMVPDIHQYANAIVDGKQTVVAATMWAAVDYLKRHGSDEDEGGLYVG